MGEYPDKIKTKLAADALTQYNDCLKRKALNRVLVSSARSNIN